MFERYQAPLITAVGMIMIPLMLRFVETAGQGSVVEGLSFLAGLLWSSYGLVSIGLGLVMLIVVMLAALLGGGRSKELNG